MPVGEEYELDRGEVHAEALGVGQPHVAVGPTSNSDVRAVAPLRAVASTESPWQARPR
jgi:hypothetical protein